MVKRKTTNGRQSDVSNREVIRILMQEMADMYKDLSEKIDTKVDALDAKLSKRLDGVDGRLDRLDKRVDALNLKMDRNYVSFIANHQELEKRVMVLENAR